MSQRVVVTGLGVVSPIGLGVGEFWESLVKGRSGVRVVERFRDCTSWIAGTVEDFNADVYMSKKDVKKTDRFTQLAHAAAVMAVEDANLHFEQEDRERVGVIVGSGVGGLGTIENQFQVLMEKGPRRISPFLVPMLIGNMASGYISIHYGLRGPNITPVTACATGTHAIGEAYRLIQRGDADVMIAGGSEAPLTRLAVSGFCAARALSTRNDEPQKASRPFDRQRDGFVMGEGSGVVVLESEAHALSRGATIYGELAGYGMSGDGYHMTTPDPEGRGAYLCMQRALIDADISPETVDYVNAHGTSTKYNDRVETQAIKKLFGDHAYLLAVSSTKSMVGHLLGAAGGVEIVATLLSMKHGIIPPTINYEEADPDCDLNYVPNEACSRQVDTAISNSFGFGGTNACLVVRRVHA